MLGFFAAAWKWMPAKPVGALTVPLADDCDVALIQEDQFHTDWACVHVEVIGDV